MYRSILEWDILDLPHLFHKGQHWKNHPAVKAMMNKRSQLLFNY